MDFQNYLDFMAKIDHSKILCITFESTMRVFFDDDYEFDDNVTLDAENTVLTIKGYKDPVGNVYDICVPVIRIHQFIMVNDSADRKKVDRRYITG